MSHMESPTAVGFIKVKKKRKIMFLLHFITFNFIIGLACSGCFNTLIKIKKRFVTSYIMSVHRRKAINTIIISKNKECSIHYQFLITRQCLKEITLYLRSLQELHLPRRRKKDFKCILIWHTLSFLKWFFFALTKRGQGEEWEQTD